MTLEVLKSTLGIVKIDDLGKYDLMKIIGESEFSSISKSNNEISIVCDYNVIEFLELHSERWRALRFAGVLDFSLKGILAKISGELARADISIFAISTYNTDYILVGEKDFDRALNVLQSSYSIVNL